MKKGSHGEALIWISNTTGKRRRTILYLAFLQIITGLISVFYALLFRRMIDTAVSGNRDEFLISVMMIAALVITQMAFSALGNFLYEWCRSVIENQLKQQLFSCLLHKSYSSVADVHSGEWMNRLTSDTVVVANGMADLFPGLVGMAARMAGAGAAISVLEPGFICFFIPAGIFAFLFSYIFRRGLKHLHKQIQEADGILRAFMQERLGSLMIIHAFAMEGKTVEEAAGKMDKHKKARMRRNRFSVLCNLSFGVATNGIYLLSAIYCGYRILKNTMSYGTMMAVLQLIGQIQFPFSHIAGYFPRYYGMIASAERLMEAENYQEDCWEESVAEQEILDFYQKRLTGIEMENVSFMYHKPAQGGILKAESGPKTKVLEHFNLEINKGECVAFTGHSGCGKSTVLKLLMCLYPLDMGTQNVIGQTGGRKTRFPLTAPWRGLFAYVPQGNQLMSGTIREILSFGDKEKMVQDLRLAEALQIACADEFVQTLKDGLDTVLGEGGSGLSEGQMQRLAIARAIFSGRPILLLDEATSALDEITEKRLLENLKAMTDRTVIIVTHRPAALDICDKKIVMG